MPDIIGRFMAEFAITLGAAIVISAVVSLTLSPALCGRLLADSRYSGAVLARSAGRGYFNRMLYSYGASLLWVLRHRGSMLIVTLLACGATIALYVLMPKGFIPPQDAGVIVGSTKEAKQSSATERMRHMREVSRIILSDDAVARVGSAITEWGNWLYLDLKPREDRSATTSEVVDRLHTRLARLPGVTTHLQPVQDFWIGGRQGYAQYRSEEHTSELQSRL